MSRSRGTHAFVCRWESQGRLDGTSIYWNPGGRLMKFNLLATTAVAALLASGGIYAQAQGPQKQDEKTQLQQQQQQQQKGAAKQQPLAAKQDRADEKQARG